MHFVVGNGQHIKLWKDKWLGNTVFMNAYPALQGWEFEELLRLLAALNSFSSNQLVPDQLRWGPKVICFNWTALHGACLTEDNLARRNFPIANRCYMCPRNAVSHGHLFLHCTVAADLWNIFISLFGHRWVMPQNFREAFESWSLWKVDSSIRKIWKMTPAAIS